MIIETCKHTHKKLMRVSMCSGLYYYEVDVCADCDKWLTKPQWYICQEADGKDVWVECEDPTEE